MAKKHGSRYKWEGSEESQTYLYWNPKKDSEDNVWLSKQEHEVLLQRRQLRKKLVLARQSS